MKSFNNLANLRKSFLRHHTFLVCFFAKSYQMSLGKVPKRVGARPCPRKKMKVTKFYLKVPYLHFFPRTIADRGVRRHVFDHTHAVIEILNIN